MGMWVNHVSRVDKVPIQYENDDRFSLCCCENDMINGTPMSRVQVCVTPMTDLSCTPIFIRQFVLHPGHYIKPSRMLSIFERDSAGERTIC
jgi:hypothetical protein